MEYCEDCASQPSGVCRHCFNQLEKERNRYKKALEEILIEALKADPYRSWDNLFNITKEVLRDA